MKKQPAPLPLTPAGNKTMPKQTSKSKPVQTKRGKQGA